MVRLLRSIVGLVLAIPAGRGSSALGFANQQPVIPPHTFSSFLQGRKAAHPQLQLPAMGTFL